MVKNGEFELPDFQDDDAADTRQLLEKFGLMRRYVEFEDEEGELRSGLVVSIQGIEAEVFTSEQGMIRIPTNSLRETLERYNDWEADILGSRRKPATGLLSSLIRRVKKR